HWRDRVRASGRPDTGLLRLAAQQGGGAGSGDRTVSAAMNLRMAELVRRSGVSRETIHYYLREGLLPRPQKTARNTALYGEEHVQRLTLIRSLRDEHLLSLKAIKGLLAYQTQLSF